MGPVLGPLPRPVGVEVLNDTYSQVVPRRRNVVKKHCGRPVVWTVVHVLPPPHQARLPRLLPSPVAGTVPLVTVRQGHLPPLDRQGRRGPEVPPVVAAGGSDPVPSRV